MSTAANIIAVIFVLSCACLQSTDGHVFRVGDCPKVEVMNDFSMKKFLGTWFVIQKFRTSSDCFAENITTSHDEYFITEKLEPLGVKIHQRGRVSFVDGQPEAVMKVSYPITSPLGDQNYWILDTDYDTYAAVWSCQRLGFGHRESAQIMSRKPSLDLPIVQKLRRRFESFGINEHYFSIIDHSKCAWNKEGETRRSGDDENDTDGNISFRFGPIKINHKPEPNRD